MKADIGQYQNLSWRRHRIRPQHQVLRPRPRPPTHPNRHDAYQLPGPLLLAIASATIAAIAAPLIASIKAIIGSGLTLMTDT